MKEKDENLREMARTILVELREGERSERRGAYDETATRGTTRFDAAAERYENSIGRDDEEIFEEKDRLFRDFIRNAARGSANGDGAETALAGPRMTRRDFLLQRLNRRAERDSGADGFDTVLPETGEASGETEKTVFTTDLRRDELTADGLPEKLSEVYRRDARRFDGPFERY